MMKHAHWWLYALMLVGTAHAANFSLIELSNTPESVAINGKTLAAVAYPYFNMMPYVSSEHEPLIDCQREGRFIVNVSIKTDSIRFRQALTADRVWVVQGEQMWGGHILKNDKRIRQDRIEFVARDCNAPLQVRRNRDAANEAMLAKIVVELKYAGKRYRLRAPDVPVGAPS